MLRDDPLPLPAFSPVAGIVRRCLAKDSSQRYQAMSEVLRALQQAWTEAAQALYAQASATQPGGGGSSGDGASAASDDEVVEDAEYEVVDEK